MSAPRDDGPYRAMLLQRVPDAVRAGDAMVGFWYREAAHKICRYLEGKGARYEADAGVETMRRLGAPAVRA